MFARKVNLLLCTINGPLRRDIANNPQGLVERFVQSQHKVNRPPYTHVCQIGDPVLRAQAEPVDPAIIPTSEFQGFVKHLFRMMKKYDAYGLAAPQIGTSAQVFVMETSEKQCKDAKEAEKAGQPIEIVDKKVFINPKMKILDYTTLTHPENCASVCGYTAHVPRAKSVEIEALDLKGKKFVWKGEGWAARIVQHEMDHLRGLCFTDRMDPKTFSCSIWDVVNAKRGKVEMIFHPLSRTAKIFRYFLYQ